MAMMTVPRMNEVLELVEDQRNEIRQHQHEKAQIRAEKVEQRKRLAEALLVIATQGGAAVTGFLHGRFEDADGNFFFPRTTIPADLLMGLGGVTAGFCMKVALDKGKEKGRSKRWSNEMETFSDGLTAFANGALAASTGMYFRKHALAGKQANKMWGGVHELVGPQTHNHPRIGAAPVASSMTDSELALALRRAL